MELITEGIKMKSPPQILCFLFVFNLSILELEAQKLGWNSNQMKTITNNVPFPKHSLFCSVRQEEKSQEIY